ncbi:MAG: carotenoid 1,2-hydratase [Calditerrivibrio sp.]|nr:carotenoid 1,2-hydratase [Calditerrivibrio sp.]
MKNFIHCTLFLIFLLASNNLFSSDSFKILSPSDYVKLPQDLFSKKDFKSQWWYFTGNVKDEKGRDFGYQFTIFEVGVSKKIFKSKFAPNRLYILHMAISDLKNMNYFFTDDTDRGSFGSSYSSSDNLSIKLKNCSLNGDLDKMNIRCFKDNFGIDLQLLAEKKAILNGKNGYSNKLKGCLSCASLYFSITRMSTRGTLKIDNSSFTVNGTSWFDREINSDYDAKLIKGWDWFSIQLENGYDLMIYRIRRTDGAIDNSSYAVLIDKDGNSEELDFGQIKLSSSSLWRSKKTGAKYPLIWDIEIPFKNIKLKVKPLLENQEFVSIRSTFNYYWEGSVKIEGTVSGKGYLEMTGY